MARLRFVHAADLHLDSPFRGIRNEAPGYVAETLRRATFGAYENIIALCVEERVDALLVAGDIYDGADRSLRAQLKFVEGLDRLERAGIRSFICHGNHDPLDGWEAQLALPEGCVRFGPEVSAEAVFPSEPKRAAVHGISYPRRVVTENLSRHFRPPYSSGFNVGLLHANVGGNTGHDDYSPCTVEHLVESGIDYWALGHVHTRQLLRRERPTIAYPGNSQGRNPRETGERGVYLVEVDDYGAVELQFRPVDVLRWDVLEIGIAGLDTEQDVLDALNRACDASLEAGAGRPVVCRLSMTGRGPQHGWLRRADTLDELREQVNSRYELGGSWLWCERIEANTASPVDRDQVAQREDFTGDLARLTGELANSPEALEELRNLLRPLYVNSTAGSYLKDDLPGIELAEMLEGAAEECLAALMPTGEELD